MAASSTSSVPPPPPNPPSAAKKTFLRRLLPLLLTANIAVGVYVLTRTSTSKKGEKNEEATVKEPSAPGVSTEATAPEKTAAAEPIAAPVTKVLPPVPEHEQRELFKWILEEKRKAKPRDSSEKKKIDEEKALLKELIRAKSIPSL